MLTFFSFSFFFSSQCIVFHCSPLWNMQEKIKVEPYTIIGEQITVSTQKLSYIHVQTQPGQEISDK